MALHIVWDEILLERMDAEVLVGCRRFFTPRKGLVTVLSGGPCLIRAIPPKAVGRTEVLEKNLQDRYREILYKAAQRGCETLRLPMLGAMEDGIPGELELRIVKDCVREFNSWKRMEVYLIVSGMEPATALEMLKKGEFRIILEDTDPEHDPDWAKKSRHLEVPEESGSGDEEQEEDPEEDDDIREMRAIVEAMMRINRELGLEDEDPVPVTTGARDDTPVEELEPPDPPILLVDEEEEWMDTAWLNREDPCLKGEQDGNE